MITSDVAKQLPYLLHTLVFELMHQVLHFAAFDKITECISRLDIDPAPKLLGNDIIRLLVKICKWQVVAAIGTEQFFATNQIDAAGLAKVGEDKGNEIG